jgi:3-deoxy-D-manno-octulosonic-acid transferase
VYLLYSLATLLTLVALSPYFVYQALRHNKYVGSLRQRLGYLPVSFNLDAEESIWIHAVSVGEVLAARMLITELRRQYPQLKLFLSTTTLAGQQLARRQVADADGVFYFPFDWAFSTRRTLDIVKPRLFVMIETEIWPNLLRECRRRGVKTMLVNGRISYRSFPRYRLVRPLFRRVLGDIDRFCVQGEEASRRLVKLGASPDRIHVTGSLKFDSLELLPTLGRGRQRVLRFFRISPNRPVLVAGSTLKGEEAAVIRAFNRLRAGRVAERPDEPVLAGRSAPADRPGNPLLVLAPRRPERFDEVERLCRQEGLSTVRRTDLSIDTEPREDAVVLDTIGELAEVYQIATVVFVGGSLVSAGGHNILEPALFGKPVVVGPHMENFAEIADVFLANDAAVQVRSERELDEAIISLMGDPVRRARLGAAARALIDANRGAKEKTMAVVTSLLTPDAREPGAVVRPFRVVH